MDLIPASDFQADVATRDENHRKFNGLKHTDECWMCGRGLTESGVANGWMIEMTTSGMLVPQGHPVSGTNESQGCFPVGSECARRVPTGYKFKN